MAEPMSTRFSKNKRTEQAGGRLQQPDHQPAPSGPQNEILDLQRAAGNRAVNQLMRSVADESAPSLNGTGIAVSQPADLHEREADRVADEVLRVPGPSSAQVGSPNGHMSGSAFEQGSQIESLRGKGKPLQESERAFFESHLGRELSPVRVHTDGEAAELAKSVNARAFTLGRDIVFGADAYKPGTMAGRRLLAHELTHVAQQQSGLTGGIQRKPVDSLGDFPEKARQPIKVITGPIVENNVDIDNLFSTEGGRTTVPLPEGVTVQFGAGISEKLRHGLSNVAGTLVQDNHLKANSSISLALDLSKYGGGHTVYRFSYVERKPRKGRKTRDVLIEELGPISKRKLTEPQKKTAEKRIADHEIKIKGSWSNDEKQSLLAALSTVPVSVLPKIKGVTIRRRSGNDPDDPDAGGRYDPERHTIYMYDRAFQHTLTRFGDSGTGFTDDSLRAIVHEIGHVIDLVPLYAEKGGSASERHIRKARSPSGHRWVIKQGTWEIAKVGKKEAKKNEFRSALKKDGGVEVTKYAETDWQESFAEAFSLYVTDPERLKHLRPNVYKYFEKNHPR